MFAVLGVVGLVAAAAISKPYATARFSIATFGATPTLVDECGADDGYGRYDTKTSRGKDASITLCFKQSEMFGGSKMIPYLEIKSSDQDKDASDAQLAQVRTALANAQKEGATGDVAKLTGYLKKLSDGSAVMLKGLPADAPEIKLYMQKVADKLKASPGTQKAVDDSYRDELWSQWKTAAIQVVSFLVIGFLTVTCIGWIARGFMGIPRRQDNP